MNWEERAMEEKMRAEIAAWKAAHKMRHSASFKASFYMDKTNHHYDWRTSEERRQQLKKERGL